MVGFDLRCSCFNPLSLKPQATANGFAGRGADAHFSHLLPMCQRWDVVDTIPRLRLETYGLDLWQRANCDRHFMMVS